MFSIREKCIFCSNILNKTYFEKDYEIPISCYSKDNLSDDIFIPYNIFKCDKCYTSQTKYLGDLNEIYKINHADSTGKIMQNLGETSNLFRLRGYILEGFPQTSEEAKTIFTEEVEVQEKVVKELRRGWNFWDRIFGMCFGILGVFRDI